MFRIDAVIYCYTNDDTNSPEFGWKYVGQTYREENRKHQHLIQNKTKFDKAIRANPNAFQYTVLERESFFGKYSTHLFVKAAEWMDIRERAILRVGCAVLE